MTAAPPPTARLLSRSLRGLLYVAAALGPALYLLTALSRAGYPYELEWMEGGMADHVRRLASGGSLYGPPSIDFTPYIYTPLYYLVGAALHLAGGEGLPSLRIVSIASSLSCLALIVALVRHETNRLTPGILAACLFAACYRESGAWLDLARADSLFLALLMGGVVALRTRPTMAGSTLAGSLVFLAFLTKQTALMVALPLCLYPVLIHRGHRRLVFPIVSVGLIAGSTAILGAVTGGWYLYYVLDLPRQHAIETPMILGFWTRDLLWPLGIGVGIGVVGLLAVRGDREKSFFLTALFAGLIGAAWFSRMHSGGYDNVLLPAYLAVAIGFGIGLDRLIPVGAGDSHGARETLAVGLCLVQFLWLLQDPRGQIPTAADREAGDRLVAFIRETPGDILIPMHGYYTTLAGKRAFAHGMALDDVFRGTEPRAIDLLEHDIAASLRARRFGAVVLDFVPWGIFQADLEAGYEPRGRLFRDPDVLMPMTGLPTRPDFVYVRRE